jgi:biotin operon repressor
LLSPFDEARYRDLLEGLEVSEIKLSALENEMTIGAEYYAPEFLRPFRTLVASLHKKSTLRDICTRITDADYADQGVPFVLSEAVRKLVENSFAAKHTASALLERAKRAVEIAIEESEEAGLAFLRGAAHGEAMVSARPEPVETATEKVRRYETQPQTKARGGQQYRTHDGASRHISDDASLYPLAAETPAVSTPGGQATLPAANQPVPGGIPARLLAAMQPGRVCSRAELLAATGISEADWTWAIRQLKEEGLVVQEGEKRGARYRLR